MIYILYAILGLCAVLLAVLIILLRENGSLKKSLEKRDITDSNNRVEMMQMLDGYRNQSQAEMARLETVISRSEARMDVLNRDVKQNLETIRATVDEKISQTLETRLGKSFEIVSRQLEMVHKSLGEMQSLSDGVNGLSRLLTNVKSRGVWGEVQAKNILDEVLLPSQYVCNFKCRRDSNENVEFAIKLPEDVYLPIDSKFPKEDYERLLAYQDEGNKEGCRQAVEALRKRVLSEASDISSKYINPPVTTDFAILFLPIEGLYAEVLRIPGLVDELQRTYKVVISGPTTLCALLNSLQMGFRTLSIQKKSSEVWKVLGKVKGEFVKFGAALEAVQKKLDLASSSISSLERRTRVMNSALKDVEVVEDSRPQEVIADDQPEEQADVLSGGILP